MRGRGRARGLPLARSSQRSKALPGSSRTLGLSRADRSSSPARTISGSARRLVHPGPQQPRSPGSPTSTGHRSSGGPARSSRSFGRSARPACDSPNHRARPRRSLSRPSRQPRCSAHHQVRQTARRHAGSSTRLAQSSGPPATRFARFDRPLSAPHHRARDPGRVAVRLRPIARPGRRPDSISCAVHAPRLINDPARPANGMFGRFSRRVRRGGRLRGRARRPPGTSAPRPA